MTSARERTSVERLADEAFCWFRIAVALDAEVRQVRAWLLDFLIWVAEREELLAFVRAELDRRWSDERKGAPWGT